MNSTLFQDVENSEIDHRPGDRLITVMKAVGENLE